MQWMASLVDNLLVGLPDFQSRNTGDFCTRKWVPVARNVVLVVVLVLLLRVLVAIRFFSFSVVSHLIVIKTFNTY